MQGGKESQYEVLTGWCSERREKRYVQTKSAASSWFPNPNIVNRVVCGGVVMGWVCVGDSGVGIRRLASSIYVFLKPRKPSAREGRHATGLCAASLPFLKARALGQAGMLGGGTRHCVTLDARRFSAVCRCLLKGKEAPTLATPTVFGRHATVRLKRGTASGAKDRTLHQAEKRTERVKGRRLTSVGLLGVAVAELSGTGCVALEPVCVVDAR